MPEISIIIPTRDRQEILSSTLRGLVRHAGHLPIEVIVVDDRSSDASYALAAGFAAGAPWPLRAMRHDGAGPAAARNAGVRAAQGAVCLFMGDDSLPSAALVERHLEFHRANPGRGAALLGLVVPAAPLDESEFIRWLHEEGAQFGYAALEPGKPVPPSCFWTSNISAKRELLLEAGGFDEGFEGAACEDAELGFRLARSGMELAYDPKALAHHFHPTDLDRTLRRMGGIGVAYRRLCELVPEMPKPSRPGLRHRVRAAGLRTRLAMGGGEHARHAVWRFLCDEALRESYWDRLPADGRPGIGRALTRRALRDPAASPPEPSAPAPV